MKPLKQSGEKEEHLHPGQLLTQTVTPPLKRKILNLPSHTHTDDKGGLIGDSGDTKVYPSYSSSCVMALLDLRSCTLYKNMRSRRTIHITLNLK